MRWSLGYYPTYENKNNTTTKKEIQSEYYTAEK